jgi:hypothetical protein
MALYLPRYSLQKLAKLTSFCLWTLHFYLRFSVTICEYCSCLYLFSLRIAIKGNSTGSEKRILWRLPHSHKGFPGLLETAEAASVVSIWPRKPISRFQWNWWSRFCFCFHIVKISTLLPQFWSDCGSRFRSCNETADAASVVALNI